MSHKSNIYKQILREYDRLRLEANRDLKERQEAVYKKIPRIDEIEREISQTGIKISKLVISNPSNADDRLIDLHEAMTGLKIEKKRLLLENGFLEDFLTLKYNCTKCEDTGYIGSEKCACFQQKFVDIAYCQSNLQDIIKAENFDYFDLRLYSKEIDKKEGISPYANIQKIYSTCTDFVKKFDKEPFNLLLYGNAGLGKTFLCNCVAKDLLDKGKTVMYVTATQLFKIIEDDRFNRNEDTEPSTYLEDIISVDLFIIDDLGTEFSTILSSSELFNIINTRLLNKKPVILSTNLSFGDLRDQYSDRIVSRIMGSYKSMKFFGDDIRVKRKFSYNQQT